MLMRITTVAGAAVLHGDHLAGADQELDECVLVAYAEWNQWRPDVRLLYVWSHEIWCGRTGFLGGSYEQEIAVATEIIGAVEGFIDSQNDADPSRWTVKPKASPDALLDWLWKFHQMHLLFRHWCPSFRKDPAAPVADVRDTKKLTDEEILGINIAWAEFVADALKPGDVIVIDDQPTRFVARLPGGGGAWVFWLARSNTERRLSTSELLGLLEQGRFRTSKPVRNR